MLPTARRGQGAILSHSAGQGKDTVANICIHFMTESETKEILGEKSRTPAHTSWFRTAELEFRYLGKQGDDPEGA